MTTYSDFREQYSKSIELGLYSEKEIFINWFKSIYSPEAKAENEKFEANKKAFEFIENAIAKLGKDLFEECFEEMPNSKRALNRAYLNGYIDNIVKEEIEYQLSIK